MIEDVLKATALRWLKKTLRVDKVNHFRIFCAGSIQMVWTKKDILLTWWIQSNMVVINPYSHLILRKRDFQQRGFQDREAQKVVVHVIDNVPLLFEYCFTFSPGELVWVIEDIKNTIFQNPFSPSRSSKQECMV